MIEAGDAVVAELAQDLAEGIRGRRVRITASGDIGRQAADHWRAVLRAAGVVVLGPQAVESEGSARIHLHDEPAAGTSYSATGLALEELSRDLVGEVVGQGDTAADRYDLLIAVADALAGALGEAFADAPATDPDA